MHCTALDFKASIMALTGEKVSAHYLVPDPSEQTYCEAGFKDMRIFNLVGKMSVHGMRCEFMGLGIVISMMHLSGLKLLI